MNTRRVYGIFRDLLGEPIRGELVTVTLEDGTFTADALYPPSMTRGWTDANGALELTLFTNEVGEIASRYRAEVKGETFFFVLPTGTSALTWSQVRALGVVEGTEQYGTLLSYIQNNPDLRGPPGPPSDGSGGSLVLTHRQNTPAATWTIPNPWGVEPAAVTVKNASGRVIFADIAESSATQIVISYPAPRTGSVFIVRS